ncbi:hypothetical protein LTR94_025161 [Friedmanniomyces endolithicus]|nr:hypothetical protein LTR94_025161 [Friedmanniomyces endolithicus]
MPSTCRLSVDLDALARNFHTLEAVAGAPAHPVVKADAYGLGASACANRLAIEGARTFFVARLDEGVALREALGAGPVIYVLEGCYGEGAGQLIEAKLRPVLNSPQQLSTWTASGGGEAGLQFDTGMSRLGFALSEAPPPFPGLRLVMSHLSCADQPEAAMNEVQRRAFVAVSARYDGAVRSLANSSGCFLGSHYSFDAVRPGICLYGGGPQGRPDPRIAPVAALTAQVLQLVSISAGTSVGYGAAFTAERPMTIATVGAGYADGLMRINAEAGSVIVASQQRPLIGRISMDPRR